jgi:hypothetical protein
MKKFLYPIACIAAGIFLAALFAGCAYTPMSPVPVGMTTPALDIFDAQHIKYGTHEYHGIMVTIEPLTDGEKQCAGKSVVECTRYSPGAKTALIYTVDNPMYLDHALTCHVDNDPQCAHHGDWPVTTPAKSGVACAGIPGSDGKVRFDSPQTCMGAFGTYTIPGRQH